MKQLLRIAVLAFITVFLWLGLGQPVQAGSVQSLPDTNFLKVDNSKIDLNNANVKAFRNLPGMYPTLAKLIVQNAPYSRIEDVLEIGGLTDLQKQRIQDNISSFTLNRPDNSMQRERINNANYRL